MDGTQLSANLVSRTNQLTNYIESSFIDACFYDSARRMNNIVDSITEASLDDLCLQYINGFEQIALAVEAVGQGNDENREDYFYFPRVGLHLDVKWEITRQREAVVGRPGGDINGFDFKRL